MAAELRFRAMGSDCHLIVVGAAALLQRGRDRVDELERRWSRFLPDSEVSRLNDARGRPAAVSADTVRLVSLATQAWRRTGGRFDPTVLGDVIRAGYDRTLQAVVIDPRNGVSTLRRNAGGIVVDESGGTVTLPSDAGFDPGGIGKGLAADLVVSELLAAGAAGACANIGGDLRVAGEGPDAGRWVVGIDHPSMPGPLAVVALRDGAVATSTPTLRTWEVEGERRHHLIDPETGESLESEAVAVSVVARAAAWAEVATKAALLAPAGAQLGAIEELGCEGLMLTAAGAVRRTRGLAQFLVPSVE